MAPLAESMIGYSQKLDLLSSIYNIRLDKHKNNKCVKNVKKSNTQANKTSNAKCKENCRGVTKTAETRIQKNGPQLKQSQDPIYHKTKSLKDVQASGMSPTPANVTTRTQTAIKTPLKTKTALNKNPYVESSDFLQKTQPMKAQKSTTVLKKNACVVPLDTFEANKPNNAHKGIPNVVSKNHFIVPSDSQQRTKPMKAQPSNTTFVNKKALVKPLDTFQIADLIKAQKSSTTIIPSTKLCAVPSDSLQRTRLTRGQASTSTIPNKRHCLEPVQSLQRNHSSKVQKCATNSLNKKALAVPLDSLKRNQSVTSQKSKAIVVNDKPTEKLKQKNSQKKTSGVNPYEVKNMSDSQPRKKVRSNNLKLEWRNFERILQSDVYTLQELYKIDVNSVFDFGADILNKLEEAPVGTAVQKMEWKGRVYYYFMKAYSAAGDQNSALEFSSLLLRFAKTTKDRELQYNTYNITAKVYVKLEDYHTAIVLWEKMIKLTENLADQAYILHEIGRCCYALSEWTEANMYGHQSLAAAKGCGNRQWCKSANLLIGQTEIRLKDPKRALQAYEEAELYALTLNDVGLLSYIEAQKKLLQNVTETKCQ